MVGSNVLYPNIKSYRILVIGDVMLDTYFSGDVNRISPEAPVPVFKKKEERSVLGGAANVASNLIAAGQNVSIMAMVGNDETGEKLKNIFTMEGVNTDLIVSLDRHTTEKTRFLASNNQQVLRLDVEDTYPLSEVECRKMIREFKNRVQDFDLIVISDYLKGLLTYEFTQSVISTSRENNIPVIIDVKDPNHKKYDGATLLKPNLKELKGLTGRCIKSEQDIINASNELRISCNCEYVLTTCGAKGMILVGDHITYSVKAVGQEVFDVTGAGDTAIAYLAACLVNGYKIQRAIDIANLAAGIQVSKVGTSAVYWTEIRERLEGGLHDAANKIVSGDLISGFRKEHKGKKIVFTNGCFDILHVGHVRYLQEAAKLGDILIIGLNSDASVKRIKGPDRPINNELERAEMLCALGFVDYVAIFDEDTPLELIQKVEPDILVKGGDYKPEEVVGKEFVEARGGRLTLIPFVEGKSTSRLIWKIRNE